MERKLNGKVIFEGKILNLRVDEIETDKGLKATREVIEHPGGTCIAAQKDNGKFLLVRQYRYAQQKEMLEFPAGRLEVNESPLEGIIREITEETGYQVTDVVSLGCIAPSSGYLEERIYLHYGKVTDYVGTHFDIDEDLMLEEYSLEELEAMIMSEEITDAKTIALVLKLRLM